jgi:hypothetical protein
VTGPGGGTPAELADAAYEAVRALNHATLPFEHGIDGSDELYRVVGSLAALLRVTPQALRQAAARVARDQRAGRVSVDGACPTDPATTVAAIVAELSAAADAVALAARRAAAAHNATAHLILEQSGPGM